VEKYYVTFGLGQLYHHRYVLILASNENNARTLMNAAHGRQWSMIYTDEQFREAEPLKSYRLLSILDERDEMIDLNNLEKNGG
jgi:hypothetical protein